MRNKFYLWNVRRQTVQSKHVKRLKLLSRHPVVIPVVVFVALVILAVGGLLIFTSHDKAVASDAFIVLVSHDHVQQTIPTREPTVGALLKKMNIKIRPGDVVEPSQDAKIDQDDFHINVYRGVPVEIVDGSHKEFTYSAATTPRSIATQAGIQTYAEDELKVLPTTNFIKEDAIGERVVINRAVQVKLNLYGHETVLRTHDATVGDLLTEKQINLGNKDTLSPSATTPIKKGMQITIARKGTKFVNKTETIPMPVKMSYSSDLAYGTSAIRQKGSSGQKVTTYKLILKNGKVVGRQKIETVVIEKPVQQIEVVGTSLSGIKADMSKAGISSSEYQSADYIISNESGWCPTKWQGQWGGCPAYHGAPSSGGYGLCQATPPGKMASAGSDWATNPITQLRWCTGYARDRYGSWNNAAAYWRIHHSW